MLASDTGRGGDFDSSNKTVERIRTKKFSGVVDVERDRQERVGFLSVVALSATKLGRALITSMKGW